MITSINELLQCFVEGRDDIRPYLRTPILRGEWIYATNGHIVVRVPKADGIAAVESDKPKDIDELFTKNKYANFIDIPALPPAEKCPVCLGSGIGYKCPDCDGKGAFDKGGHNYCCKECDGSGQVDDGRAADKELCVECDGAGDAPYMAVKVGEWHYNRRYLAKIESLPEVKFAPPPEVPTTRDDVAAAYFVFDGGEGLLMSMRA